MKTIKEFLRYYNSRVYEGLLPKSNNLETDIISKHITVGSSGSIKTKETKIIIDTKEVLAALKNYNVHVKLENLKEGTLRKILKNLIIKNSNNILFDNCELTDNMIAELNKIKNIHDINICNCSSLKSVSDMNNVGWVKIYDCSSLKSVSGMNNNGWVEIHNCSSLKSVSDMNNDRGVVIKGCSSLESVYNMNNKGGVTIEGCSSLESVSGFENSGWVRIDDCSSLKSVYNINSKEGMTIDGCSSLESVSGVDENNLEIKNCPNYKKNKKV